MRNHRNTVLNLRQKMRPGRTMKTWPKKDLVRIRTLKIIQKACHLWKTTWRTATMNSHPISKNLSRQRNNYETYVTPTTTEDIHQIRTLLNYYDEEMANLKLFAGSKLHFECPECMESRRPKARRLATVPRSYRTNHVVGVDLILVLAN